MRRVGRLLPPLVERAGTGGDERRAEHGVQQHQRSNAPRRRQVRGDDDRDQLQHDDPRLGELDVIGNAREPTTARTRQQLSETPGSGGDSTHTATPNLALPMFRTTAAAGQQSLRIQRKRDRRAQ